MISPLQILKKIATALPHRWQQGLKRRFFAMKLRHGRFTSEEQEYERLAEFVSPGDWVLDIGANVGIYSARLSELVGPEGRVFAFEPIPDTFELLAANAQHFPFPNATLLNVAASDTASLARMNIPHWDAGGQNYYEAHIVANGDGTSIFTLPVDALHVPQPVQLVKIDTEGHELAVLRGMTELLARDHPTLIVEANSGEVVDFLAKFGYESQRDPNSANYVFCFRG